MTAGTWIALRRAMRLGVLLLCAGCTPVLPFHFAETAETLKKGGVSLTVAGGGGGARDVGRCCGGGSVRVSAGVGHRMEVGVETSVIGGDPQDHEIYVLGKVRCKAGFGRYLALLAGLGASGAIDTRTGSGDAGVGGDLALVWSTGAIGRVARIYGGARFTFMFAVERDFYGGLGPTQGFVVPLGVSFAATHALRLYVEGGLLGGWSESRSSPSRPITVYDWIGGYGSLAIAYNWNS